MRMSTARRLLPLGCTIIALGCGSAQEEVERDSSSGAAETETGKASSYPGMEEGADGTLSYGAEPADAYAEAQGELRTAQIGFRELRCGPRPDATADTLVVTGPWGYYKFMAGRHRLDVMPGTVPAGQTYTFILQENRANRAVVDVTRTAGPLGNPQSPRGPRFMLSIDYSGCTGDSANATLIHRRPDALYHAVDHGHRSWVQVHMPELGSTYAAAAPSRDGLFLDTLRTDTTRRDTVP